MTEYVYRLTTNVPVGAFGGAGGVPDVHHSTAHGNISERGIIGRAQSHASSASDGHKFELELIEVREDVIADVDATILKLGLTLEPWQRSQMIAMFSAMRRR